MLTVRITARLHAPWCRSLKDKRAEIQSLISRIRRKFNVSIIESGLQDIHARMELTIAALAFDAAQADSISESLYHFILGATEAELIEWDQQRQ